jgi:hypothetical protein
MWDRMTEIKRHTTAYVIMTFDLTQGQVIRPLNGYCWNETGKTQKLIGRINMVFLLMKTISHDFQDMMKIVT